MPGKKFERPNWEILKWSMVPLLLCLLNIGASSQTPLPTNILQRLNVGGTDRMTTLDPSIELCSPEECPSEGQVFYVADSQEEPGTSILYRFSNGWDHLDSIQLEDTCAKGPWVLHLRRTCYPDSGDWLKASTRPLATTLWSRLSNSCPVTDSSRCTLMAIPGS